MAARRPQLRLALVRSWIWANRAHPLLAGPNRDELAAALAAEKPFHPLWDAFAQTQLDEFAEKWRDFDRENWGAASRPRPITPDYELVLLVYTGGKEIRVERETEVEAIALLMRSTPAGWRVAGFSEAPLIYEWPDE
jgi:hypothetical protein